MHIIVGNNEEWLFREVLYWEKDATKVGKKNYIMEVGGGWATSVNWITYKNLEVERALSIKVIQVVVLIEAKVEYWKISMDM